MEYFKKHYEKVILVIVLLGVAGSAFWLTNQVDTVRTTLEEQLRRQIGGKQKPLPPANLTNALTAFSKIAPSFGLNLSGEHKTFNPVAWMKAGDAWKRVGDKGQMLSLLRINPLNLNITYTGVTGVGDPLRYQFVVERTHEKQPQKRRPLTTSVTEGSKTEGTNSTFLLREVKPPKDAANEVTIELVGERIALLKDKVYSRVMAYSADLKSETVNREFTGKRQDETVSQSGVTYKIISITPTEVILEAPNKTRSTLRLPSAQ